MKGLLAVCAFWSLATVCASQEAHDWLIVPGERVGPITATTSEAMLSALFGAGNVEPGEVGIGEGFTEPGAVIYGSESTKRLEIVWQDATRMAPESVRISGDVSDWKTAQGISLGTTLKEVEGLNGYPFRLAGFGWDYGGTIVDCGRGRMKLLGCMDANRRVQGRLLLLRLNPSSVGAPLPEYGEVVGEGPFSSGHPAMQALNPRVYQMIVTFSR